MSDVTKAIQAICDEKGLQFDAVLESIEAALAAAYRKDFGNRQQNIKMKFDPETGDMKAWDVKIVVEDIDPEQLEKDQEELVKRREQARVEDREITEEETADLTHFNPKLELMLAEAKAIDKKVKVGETMEIKLEIPGEFGRMAAQTAKQVIIQRLREAERSNVYDELKGQEGEVIQGIVQRRDKNGAIIIDLGKVTGIVPANEQMRNEQYRPGVKMRFLLASIAMGVRGVEIVLSRSNDKMVEAVFKQEIPEIEDGSVVIKGIARDPGNRSKVAVFTEDGSIDPVGACIGQRGSRINAIIGELGGEKIDIINFDENPETYLKNSLSPAKIESVELNNETKEAMVNVAPDQFSLAIGRGGQNVRLSAKLTGWTIKIVETSNPENVISSDDDPSAVAQDIGEKVDEVVEKKVEAVEEKKEIAEEEVKVDDRVKDSDESNVAGEKEE